MAAETSTGKCLLCGATVGKSSMTRHVKSCKKNKTDGSGPEKTPVFHLVVEGRYLPEYWLHLEVQAEAGLRDLDAFLRSIWLECCGHLSAFTIDGEQYLPEEALEDDEACMDDVSMKDVLTPGKTFFHTYDFGTSTELQLRAVSQSESAQSESAPNDSAIELLARNDPPEIACGTCGEPAVQVCSGCIFADDKAWCCDECASKHECGEEMLLPVTNSPRVGMCAYTGEQDNLPGWEPPDDD